jgi:hypothetical protein
VFRIGMRSACGSPAAHRDAGQDRHPAGKLTHPRRVPEDDDARDGADHGLDVHEGAGHLG